MTPNELSPRAELAHGYAAITGAAGAELRIVAPDQRVCLTITLTPEGPRVELSAVSLRVEAQRSIDLTCGSLTVEARDAITLRAGGAITTEGAEQHHSSTRGDITLDANDDLYLDGETVNLYVPPEERAPRAPLALRAPTPESGTR